MNVARKSTTKLPQKWQQDQKLESREDEADSGIASTDSTDSFQDALLNLKALSGSGDMADSDRSEVKEAQSSSAAHKVQNGDGHDRDLSKENAEDRDILEQIDDIVNSSKTTDIKTDQGSEEDDDVLIIKDDEAKENGKDSSGVSKVKNVPTKNPLRIGEKVRSTVHSIMSKLVQSNPDVNNLLSKTKSDGCADSGESRGASPVPPRPDKGNLFDIFDVSEGDSKSSQTASTSKPQQQAGSDKENERLQEVTEQAANEDSEEKKYIVDETSVDTSGKEQNVDGCVDGSASLENPRKGNIETDVKPVLTVDPDDLKSDSHEATVETKCDSVNKVDSSPQNDPVLDSCVDKKDKDNCSDETVLTSSGCDIKSFSGISNTGSSDSKNEDGVSRSEEMETADPESCDKVIGKVSICDSVEDKAETDRKRPLEDVKLDTESSQPPKRSRLDEVIGKLGERVTFPSGIDSYDYEDSPLGDTDSLEKQSEEISGSTSDEEEDKSVSDSKSKKICLTQQELETLVMTTAKKAVEQYQSTEVAVLNRRLEELMETQEEWRQKAKNLERQVLDLTVLQQRLEKRKAHAAALKSITTRSIGIWVTEDKFLKSITPQKHPGNRTPPATPTTTAQGQPPWAANSQSGVRSLVSEPTASSVSNGVISAPLGVPPRNTSVAHLLSQTARMPTVASCQAANRSTPANRGITTGPRLSGSSTMLVGSQSTSLATPLTRGQPPSSMTPVSSLMLVSTVPGVPSANKTVPTPQGGATTVVTPAGSTQVKVIDLTMEDDGAPKQVGKVVNSGAVRAMLPQQVVRQITPASQSVPGVPSSAILLSSPAGTQIVNTGNIQRPGMLQVVTIANAQSIRPAPIFTVMQGQTGSIVRPPTTAATFTTSARDSSPLVMAQQLPAGVTFIQPPTTVIGNNASMRPSPAPPTAGATTVTSTARASVGLTTAQPHAAAPASLGPIQIDGTSQPVLSATAKKNIHPAPLPEHIRPKGLPADLKPPPPCPGLKISRVKQGIVLSWNMSIPSDCVEIASYQLFAYQETSAAPQTSLWKKVGDVKALPLPMACTLTQFQDGNKYHFAVRAIDVHGRSGPFSDPSYIFLTKAA